MYDGFLFFGTLQALDEFDAAHCQELLDHGIGSEYNLSLLHLHSCPAVG